LCTLCLAAFLAPGSVVADADANASTPIKLSTAQMDEITAGTGRENMGVNAWSALSAAGFNPGHLTASNQGVIDNAGFEGLIVPTRRTEPTPFDPPFDSVVLLPDAPGPFMHP
jgi:hypothetical protein